MTETANKKSTLVNRNIRILGRRTSVRLESTMWDALNEIAKREQCSIHDICSLIHLRKKQNKSLIAAIRVFIVLYFRKAATEEGHRKAGHGNFINMIARARLCYPPTNKQPASVTGIPEKANQPEISF